MPAPRLNKPVFRFAPSPNGLLHLGHALSAILNHDHGGAADGRVPAAHRRYRSTRCTRIRRGDLSQISPGSGFSGKSRSRRQSEHFAGLSGRPARLIAHGRVYPAFFTRGEVKARVAAMKRGQDLAARSGRRAALSGRGARARSRAEAQDLDRGEGSSMPGGWTWARALAMAGRR